MIAPRSLCDHLAFQERLRPGALAVYGAAGPVSYQALMRDVDALATELLERGIGRQDMVGLQLGFSYLHLLLIAALDRLSIPTMSFTADPSVAPQVDSRYGLTTIISGRTAPAGVSCRWIVMPEQHRPTFGRPDDARLARVDSPPDSLVRVAWSSGTTGGAKGAPLSRTVQMQRLMLRRMCHDLGPGARYFTAMPFGSVPCYSVALATLTGGGAVILPCPGTAFVDLANALGVTMTTVSPGLLADLVYREGRRARRLETVTCLNVVGANLPSRLAQDVQTGLTPHLRISYGTSEIDVVSTADAAVAITEPSAAGFVLPWVEVEVVDEADRPLPVGAEGALRLRSESMVAGYYEDDAATRRNFRDGWFYPGDLGALTAERLLRITGRVEEVIRRDGVAVSPLPVEAAMRSLSGVRDVAVFALAAGGTEQVCAALVLDAGADVARIRAEAATRLGAQAPARLFVIDKLPRNANGKVLRRELVAMAERSVKA